MESDDLKRQIDNAERNFRIEQSMITFMHKSGLEKQQINKRTGSQIFEDLYLVAPPEINQNNDFIYAPVDPKEEKIIRIKKRWDKNAKSALNTYIQQNENKLN